MKRKCLIYNTAFQFLFILFTALLFAGCGGTGKSNSGDENNSSLPQARGEVGEIIVVMDSSKWNGGIGAALKEELRKTFPGLPQSEPYFSINQVSPFALNNVLRNARNMIFVTTLDNQSAEGREMRNYFTPKSLERIRDNPDFFMYNSSNEYARGQSIMHLFGPDDATLINNIKSSGERIRDHFYNKELDYLSQRLFRARQKKGISRFLLENHGIYLRIPYGFEIAEKKDNFTWIRKWGRREDQSVFITYKPYTSQDVFQKENIKQWRDNIGKRYFMEGDSVYMQRQEIYPLQLDTLNWKDRFVIQTRGLWKMSNNTMGGPFLSYVFVDEPKNRVYYMEGFVYAPSKNKKRLMWEMEAILNTFKTRSELENENQPAS